MAKGDKIPSSASVANSDNKTSESESKIEKSSFLFYNVNNFTWKGDLNSLKTFVAAILKCDDGKWSSPRGEEKLFKSKDFSLKWHGPKKEKLQIMKDNEEKSLQSALEASAQANGVINQDENIKTTKHMVDVVNKQHDPKPDFDENHSMCGNCEVYKHQIANIMTLINEIKAKQEEESQRAVFKSKNLEITIKTLSQQNDTMAGEIEQLNLSVSELSGDNANIKCVLDIKQNEWTKTDQKAKISSKPAINKEKIPLTPNAFQVLDVEEPSSGNHQNPKEANHPRGSPKCSTRCRKRPKPEGKELREDPGNNVVTMKKSFTKQSQEKAVLVIGDSMVKHIDGNKIGRAARGKTISHSYSGATVNQLANKFDENHAEKEQYNTIILHVGTNDLVREEPKKVAADMENLINKAKAHTNKLAVSGVIKRYDGKVNNHKIDQYNKLANDLCSKHKITFINNSCIGKSLLNRSNLDLNRDGDKALGSSFCTYLKSDRISTSNSNNHFFRPPSGRLKEWTMYLNHVKRMMKHKLE
jgi:lysophospholipase L1-like esterase